jgi:hypothetical protein
MGLRRVVEPLAGFEGFAGFNPSPSEISTHGNYPTRSTGATPAGGGETRTNPKPRTRPSLPATAPAASAWFLALIDVIGAGATGATIRQCPAHTDATPSLSIGAGENGKLLVHCHAGCTWQDVFTALGLPAKYLNAPPPADPAEYAAAFCRAIKFPPVTRSGHPSSCGYRLEAEHAYGDRWWLLRYRHPVTKAKEVSWEALNDKGERVPGLLGTPTRDLPLYMERQVRMAIAADEPVLLVESESSADALMRAGWYATTWAGGAASVQVLAIRKVLLDYPHVVVVPDNDEPGVKALSALRNAGVAPHVLMPAEREDARDLLTRVGRDEFRRLVDAALSSRPDPSEMT